MPGIAAKDLPRRTAEDRVQDWQAKLADGAERSWTLPNGATVTISDVSASGHVLSFSVAIHRPNGTLFHADRHVVAYPPIYHPDGGADAESNPTYAPNIRAILRDIVVRNLP